MSRVNEFAFKIATFAASRSPSAPIIAMNIQEITRMLALPQGAWDISPMDCGPPMLTTE